MIGDLVEVEATLAYTGQTSLNLSVEVRSGDMKGGRLEKTAECAIVFVSVDSHGRALPVEPYTLHDDAQRNRAARIKAHLDAARQVTGD